MKSALKCLVLLISVAVFAACNNSKNIMAHKPQTTVNAPFQGIYWKLIQLMGEPIKSANNSREAFIKFNTDGKSVGGNGGCNTFGGSYELADSSHISFGPIMSTKMYCEDAKYENLFFDVLNKADNFYINGDTLFVRNATMDSTAKFTADYFKK